MKYVCVFASYKYDNYQHCDDSLLLVKFSRFTELTDLALKFCHFKSVKYCQNNQKCK